MKKQKTTTINVRVSYAFKKRIQKEAKALSKYKNKTITTADLMRNALRNTINGCPQY